MGYIKDVNSIEKILMNDLLSNQNDIYLKERLFNFMDSLGTKYRPISKLSTLFPLICDSIKENDENINIEIKLFTIILNIEKEPITIDENVEFIIDFSIGTFENPNYDIYYVSKALISFLENSKYACRKWIEKIWRICHFRIFELITTNRIDSSEDIVDHLLILIKITKIFQNEVEEFTKKGNNILEMLFTLLRSVYF